MKIIEINTYRDGGTISIQTDEGEYCIDRRFGFIYDLTRGMLFKGHPDEKKRLNKQTAQKVKDDLLEEIKNYPINFYYEQHYIDAIKLIKTEQGK